MTRLLTSWEVFDYTPETIKESREQNNGKVMMRGILQKADTLNQNGRIYPKDILEREVRNYQKFILENRSTGECDHPADSVINLKNVSHIVREARMDGNVVYGTVELLNTPAGKILQTLVESGIKLGISSRGIGSTAKKGDYYVVQDDFQLICWDFVSEPSTTQAFMMAEGKEISASSARKALTKSDRIDRIVNDILFGMKR